MRKLRNHGSNARNVHSYGFNSRLDDLHAGVLSAKLKHIDAWNDQRRKWAARYTAGLKDCKTFTLPVELPGYRHIFHLYVIETRKPEHRDKLVDFLVARRHRRQDPLQHRDPPAGRLSVGQGRPHRRAAWPTPSRTPPPASASPCSPNCATDEVDYVIAKVKEWDQANA